MKKGILCVLFVLFFPLAFLLVQCQFEAAKENDGNKKIGRAAGEFEEKKYSNATLEDKFTEDRVVIVLNKSASMNLNKTYTVEDFSEIQCVRVTESTRLTKEIVRQQIQAERTKNWSNLQRRIELGMLINVEKFRRILDIHLPERSKENVLRAIKLLENREDVLYAGPDYYMEIASLPYPEPDYYSWQEDALESLSLPYAWEITVGDSYLMVGVLDTGIQSGHPALYDLVNRELSRDFTTYTDHGYVYPYGLGDTDGHGTHVSGIIATNGTGVAGTCWGLSLVSLRVFDEYGGGKFSFVRYAVDFAANNYIPILNYSGGGSNLSYDLAQAIIDYPGLLVCSSGNNNYNTDINPHYPSNFSFFLDNVISVGAITTNGSTVSKAGYPDPGWGVDKVSNYGTVTVDLFAPGTNIASTFPQGKCNNGSCDYCINGGGTYIADGYHTLSGTSMAAPYVTGVAALVKSLHPEMTGAELKIALKDSVDMEASLIGLCRTGGKINAYKAVNYVPIVGSFDITFNGTGFFDVNNNNIGEVLVGKFHLFMNGDWVITEMGKISYPMNNHGVPDSYLETPSLPPEIETYMVQSGNSSMLNRAWFNLEYPAEYDNVYYTWTEPFFITVDTDNSININHDRGSPIQTGTILATDKSKIRIPNRYSGP